jgi:hypothetical protein
LGGQRLINLACVVGYAAHISHAPAIGGDFLNKIKKRKERWIVGAGKMEREGKKNGSFCLLT